MSQDGLPSRKTREFFQSGYPLPSLPLLVKKGAKEEHYIILCREEFFADVYRLWRCATEKIRVAEYDSDAYLDRLRFDIETAPLTVELYTRNDTEELADHKETIRRLYQWMDR
jgi:hypothetical protein